MLQPDSVAARRLFLFIIFLSGIVTNLAGAQAPFPGTQPVNIGLQLPAAFETSGITWHPRLERYYLVGDEGNVASMDANGFLRSIAPLAADLEAVTIADAATNFIYIGTEVPNRIFEYNILTGFTTRIFTLTPFMPSAANQGLEGLAFVPIPGHPEGGVFHASNQTDGRVYVFSLPVKSSATSTTVTFISSYLPVPGRTDLADLCYDPLTGTLLGAYDNNDRLTRFTTAGAVLNDWVLPGDDQEAIALRNCELVVGRDAQKLVFKYRDFPSSAACQGLWTDTPFAPVATTGIVNFSLQSSSAHAFQYYFLLGSASGTNPGVAFDGVLLPLNPDEYFDIIGNQVNGPIFINTFGTLSATAGGSAALSMPGGLSPTLVGLTLDHAYLVLSTSFQILASSPVARITLTP